MGAATGIRCTDSTFNPWWGCTHVSPGCVNCYAETVASRRGLAWGVQADRRFYPDKHWNEPRVWDRRAAKDGVPRRVFCASMADVFEDRRDLDAQRARLWSLIEETPNLRWQLLSKRPENVLAMIPPRWLSGMPSNVWLGTSVEDRLRLGRVDVLRTIPVHVRFLSVEPLLEDLDVLDLAGIGWVIVGGESGPGARPMRAEWARSVRDQCIAGGVPFFFKQWGGRAASAGGHVLDGRTWDEFPSGG